LSTEDPRAELSELVGGFTAYLRRRARAGLRRVELEAPEPSPPVGPDPPKAPTRPQPRGHAGPPQPGPDAPRRTEPRPVPILDAPGPRPARPGTPDPAEEVRRRAAACETLEELRAAVAECTACALCKTRTQTVFSDGHGTRGVLFVGEAPGENEDRQGVPFVGRAGALLTDIVTKGMGLTREEVYIANILKCRPPANRDPSQEEKRTCSPWLDRQIELVAPKVLVPLGRHASGHLLASDQSMGRMRGRVHERGGRKVVPTFHPAYLLRSPQMKKDCWQDIQLAMRELGLERPGGP